MKAKLQVYEAGSNNFLQKKSIVLILELYSMPYMGAGPQPEVKVYRPKKNENGENILE